MLCRHGDRSKELPCGHVVDFDATLLRRMARTHPPVMRAVRSQTATEQGASVARLMAPNDTQHSRGLAYRQLPGYSLPLSFVLSIPLLAHQQEPSSAGISHPLVARR